MGNEMESGLGDTHTGARLGLLVSVVAGADKRTGFHVSEAHLHRLALQHVKLVGSI